MLWNRHIFSSSVVAQVGRIFFSVVFNNFGFRSGDRNASCSLIVIHVITDVTMIYSQMPKIVRNFLLSIDFLDKKKIVKPSEKSLAIYDGNHATQKNCELKLILRNKRIVYVKTKRTNNFKSQWINQRPRSGNNVNVDIFRCLGRRELEERWNLVSLQNRH